MHRKRCFLTAIILLSTINTLFAQETSPAIHITEGVVTYALKNNGKVREGAFIQLFFKNNIAYLSGGRRSGENERQYMDYTHNETLQILTLDDGSRYTLKTPFSDYEQPELTGERDTILGVPCQKAKVVVRSNTIEIWFTKEFPLKGTPSLRVAPGIGLILKMIRNGSFEIYATEIDFSKITNPKATLPQDLGTVVNEATYHRQEIDSRFLTIPIFTQQQINFTDSIKNPEVGLENETYRYAGGTQVLKKVHLPSTENYSVFAHLTQYSNGDAYDRTGSVFVIPTSKKISFLDGIRKSLKVLPVYTDNNGKEYQGVIATENYLPPLELMRFFTPFGVNAYNEKSQIAGYHWADSVHYKQDITDLLPRLTGDVWMGVFIGNYDSKGHTINLNLEYHPQSWGNEEKSNWVMPIFNTLNVLEMAGQSYATLFGNDSLSVTVNIPENLKRLTLRYITTGHGGWGGGDEFNQKLNEIFVDGERVYSFIPWRTDCATYRMYNPSSGNFSNGLSSSDLSRSNWCPGTTTNPVYIPINDLSPGMHTFTIAIPMGKPEGNSFSAWNVSGVLIGEFQ